MGKVLDFKKMAQQVYDDSEAEAEAERIETYQGVMDNMVQCAVDVKAAVDKDEAELISCLPLADMSGSVVRVRGEDGIVIEMTMRLLNESDLEE